MRPAVPASSAASTSSASATSASSPSTRYAPTIPFVLFAAFQLMFAAITPALITGAFAERKRFSAFVLFTILWSTFVYSPIAHWVWAPDGWLHKLGALDFAGGTVVHISVRRLGAGRRPPDRASGVRQRRADASRTTSPMTVLGAGLLWFGWFGFNAGSALAASGPGRQRVPGHQHRGRGGDPDLGPRELPPPPQGRASSAPPAAPSPGWSRSRPASGYVTAGRGDRSSVSSPARSATRDAPARAHQASTMRWTCSLSTAWAACSGPSRRASSRWLRSVARPGPSRATWARSASSSWPWRPRWPSRRSGPS